MSQDHLPGSSSRPFESAPLLQDYFLSIKKAQAVTGVSPRSRVAEGYAAILFLFYILLILVHHSLPVLTDFCDWTYEGVLLRNRLIGIVDTAHLLKHYPVPNSASTVGVALVALLVSWHVAAKLWICVSLVASFLASRHIMRTRDENTILWAIAPAAIFLNVNLWYGFINFQLGLCCVILFSSLLLRGERQEWKLGFLLLVAFFCHMIPFAFAGVLLVLYAQQTRRFRLLLQLAPAAVLSAWYVFGRFLLAHNADGQSGMVSPVRSYSLAFWAYKINSYMKSFGFINPGSRVGSVTATLLGPLSFIALHILNLCLCGAIGWCLAHAALAAYRLKKAERFIWTAALLFLPLYLLAPGTTLGISDPGSRLLQTALAVTVFLCSSHDANRSVLRVAAVCGIALQLAGLFLFAHVVFSPQRAATSIPHLPRAMVTFAHVPNHTEDFYFQALERGDMKLWIFPTAMFLNTPEAESSSAYTASCCAKH